MRNILVAAIAAACSCPATAAEIATMAGDGFGGCYSTQQSLFAPVAVVADGNGNTYIAEAHCILRVSADGLLYRVGGSASPGFGGDGGPASLAQFSDIQGLALDGQGNLYVADAGNARVRKIDRNRTVSAVAGTGTAGF